MVQAELTITNEQGIHLGPANKIANLADRYDCTPAMIKTQLAGCICFLIASLS